MNEDEVSPDQSALPALPGRRRPRHPHPEGSQGGACEAEVAFRSCSVRQGNLGCAMVRVRRGRSRGDLRPRYPGEKKACSPVAMSDDYASRSHSLFVAPEAKSISSIGTMGPVAGGERTPRREFRLCRSRHPSAATARWTNRTSVLSSDFLFHSSLLVCLAQTLSHLVLPLFA